ncbi:MAG: hypothetical protein ACJ77K_13090 [Bacteroidia bacterium]
MRKLLCVLPLIVLAACGQEAPSTVSIEKTNTIPWDTLGSTVEGKKIKVTDMMEPGKPSDETALISSLEHEFNRKSSKKRLSDNFSGARIMIFAQVDTNGKINDLDISNNCLLDSATMTTLNLITRKVSEKSAPWIPPVDHGGNKMSGKAFFCFDINKEHGNLIISKSAFKVE